MFDIAKFEILGRVGNIKAFDKLTKVSVAVNTSYKEKGQWIARTDWNEVTIFNQSTREWIASALKKGDYVRITGSLRQGQYVKDGKTVYTTELIVDELFRKPVAAKTQPEEIAA